MHRRSLSFIAAGSCTALVASLGLAVAPSATGNDFVVGAAGIQYGTWAQPGAGFASGADDTMSQVYQLTSRSAFPDLDDTPGPVYAAGTFVASESTTINRVGQWDSNTSTWVTLPGDDTGIGFGTARSVASGAVVPGVYGLVLGGDDSLYVGGEFIASDDTLNNVAQWNGTDWVAMGNGLRFPNPVLGAVVQDMVIGNDFIGMDDTNYADDTVYALGGFSGTCATLSCTALGRTAAGVAQYSQADDTWYPVGNGQMTSGYSVTPQAYSGAYIDDTLYIGGSFVTVGGVAAANIAQWSASSGSWLPVGAGISHASQWDGVFSMAVHPITKDLYVGGQFSRPVGGSTAMGGIVKWDYTDDTWYTVGTGLTGGNTDDISFSADGKTMWIGSWATAPKVDGTFANGLAKLTSDDFVDPAATTINGSWDYLQSSGVIGVTGPGNPNLNQTSTRAVLSLSDGSVMAGGNFHSAGSINANRVAIFTPGPAPDPYAPVFPPGAPTNVVATPEWKSVRVNWTAPTNTGSYPITNYLVTANPGGQVCITRLTDPDLTECTFTSLTPGTEYTFTVQGLNGGGWGERSAASNAATPQDIRVAKYRRTKVTFLVFNRGSRIEISGRAPGFPDGTILTPWLMFGDNGAWESVTSTSVRVRNGGFSWTRKFGKARNSRAISVRFTIGENESNTVTMGPIR